jgi:hypothetical protein
MTALIVIACLIAHLALASATRYLIERVCKPDSYDSGMVTAGCAVGWPIALMVCATAWGKNLAAGREETWKDEALRNRKVIADLQAQVSGLKIKPPAQGVHR